MRGLWSVLTWNSRPSTKCRKCLMARYTASSSRSKALYFVSAGFSFLEKKEIGHHTSSINCCWTAPTAMSDASVAMHVGADGLRSVALARASLLSSNALVVSAVHDKAWEERVVDSKVFNGCRI